MGENLRFSYCKPLPILSKQKTIVKAKNDGKLDRKVPGYCPGAVPFAVLRLIGLILIDKKRQTGAIGQEDVAVQRGIDVA
jgi:hypothetical protein